MQWQTILRSCGCGLVIALLPALAAAALPVTSPTFAAPAAYSATGAGLGALRVLLALALVLAAVFAAAALLRRLRVLAAGASAELQLVGQIVLGTRERAVLLRAGNQHFLIGVAPGSVRLLSALADVTAAAATPVASTPADAAPRRAPGLASFRELLRRSLSR